MKYIDPSKASGPDEIPRRLLQEGAPWIAKPLLNLFNASLKSGRLPRDWTRANITPVFKKDNKHSPKNYLPVSLTNLVVKVLERRTQRRHVKFLSDNIHSSMASAKPIPVRHNFWRLVG